jgi:hypothetical protein
MAEITSDMVSEIRKSGDLDKAEALIAEALSNVSLSGVDRFKIEQQLHWCKQGRVKNYVLEINESKKKGHDCSSLLQSLHVSVRELYKLTNGYTNKLLAKRVLLDVTKVSDMIEWYSDFAFTVIDGSNLLEDPTFWEPNQYNGETYKPDVYTVSRALVKDSVKTNANVTVRDGLLITMFERMIPNLTDDIKVWAESDLLALYRKVGNKELEYSMLKILLEKKNTESWMWKRAYDYYKDIGELETAISCLAKGISCSGVDDFKVKILKSLVIELIAVEKSDLAAQFGLRLSRAYEKNGWPLPKEIKDLLSGLKLETITTDLDLQDSFVKSTIRSANNLLYVSTKTLKCTYVEEVVVKLPDKNKTKWKLSYQENGVFKSRLIPAKKNLRVAPGVSIVLELGQMNSGLESILSVALGDDPAWAHCQSGVGFVVGSNNAGDLYIEIAPLKDAIRTSKNCVTRECEMGDVVEYRLVQGKEKPEVCLLVKSDKEYENRRAASGALKIIGNGSHGFVEDIFVPAKLLNNQATGEVVNIIAKKSWDRKKNKESWEAVRVIS